jgi:ribosomal protein S18 acetylase RimI-like enzyme
MDIRTLGPNALDLLLTTAPGLFDATIDPVQAKAFLNDPRHHMVAGFDNGQIVAFASGTVTLHRDKPPSLFIDEVGTRESHQRQGYGAAVTRALIEVGRAQGCQGAWVGTEPGNSAARALYAALGGEALTFVGYGWDGAFNDAWAGRSGHGASNTMTLRNDRPARASAMASLIWSSR